MHVLILGTHHSGAPLYTVPNVFVDMIHCIHTSTWWWVDWFQFVLVHLRVDDLGRVLHLVITPGWLGNHQRVLVLCGGGWDVNNSLNGH